MKNVAPLFFLSFLTFSVLAQDHKTLAIGSAAPYFSLKGVDDKIYSLNSFKNAKILAIVFTCNHCPTAQAYEDRLIRMTNDYSTNGVAVVAIMPNDPSVVSLDELGYTDLGDSFEEMKIRSTEKKFNFPYLYDGETESVALAYGPIATPHIYLFDEERKLRYTGRIDDTEKPGKLIAHNDARDALDALLQKRPVSEPTTKVFGCSIKWSEKNPYVLQSNADWAKLPVSLDTIGVNGLKRLLKNPSDKLRMINVWATWCGPCVTEYPEFITIHRMYKNRDFEFISVSADDPTKKDKALKLLKAKQSAVTNYIFNVDDKYKLIEAIDPKWQGALPYTIVVEPGGKIIYARQGTIDPQKMKKLIVEHPLIGRYY